MKCISIFFVPCVHVLQCFLDNIGSEKQKQLKINEKTKENSDKQKTITTAMYILRLNLFFGCDFGV